MQKKRQSKRKLKVAAQAVPLKEHRLKVRYVPEEVELSPLEIEHAPSYEETAGGDGRIQDEPVQSLRVVRKGLWETLCDWWNGK